LFRKDSTVNTQIRIRFTSNELLTRTLNYLPNIPLTIDTSSIYRQHKSLLIKVNFTVSTQNTASGSPSTLSVYILASNLTVIHPIRQHLHKFVDRHNILSAPVLRLSSVPLLPKTLFVNSRPIIISKVYCYASCNSFVSALYLPGHKLS
jgi:hypothetical protein